MRIGGLGPLLLVAFAALGELLPEQWPKRVRLVVLPASALVLVIATLGSGYDYYVS